jgi:1-deoxy-D-xylulose-5-phosphate synthase
VPEPIEWGRAEVSEPAAGPRPVWFWALGDMLPLARQAAALVRASGFAAGVVNARFVKPLDEALLRQQAATARLVATVENGAVAGGFGSAVAEALSACGVAVPTLAFGWPDRFVEQGTTEGLRAACGLTPEAMAAAVLARLKGP